VSNPSTYIEAMMLVESLRAENAKLREYIKAGGHTDECFNHPDGPCFCGYDAVLAGAVVQPAGNLNVDH
jgi:hypothetical protein